MLSALAFAIPDSLTLQGKLTNLAGTSQSGAFNFTFAIYDAYTGGNVLYRVNLSITTDSNGIYDVILQNLSSLNFSEQYYLGIMVGSDSEMEPRINLTSAPYSFRANVSEALNRENRYEIAVLNITGNLTLGQDSDDIITVTTGRLNISDGNIISGGNLTLTDRITFRFNQIIDGLVSGFLRINGNLNVTGNVSIAQDTLFVDNTSGKVGIGTTSPLHKLTVVGTVNATSLNGSLDCTNIAGGSDSDYCTDAGLTGINTNDLAIVNVTMFDNNTIIRTGNLSLIFSERNNSLWNITPSQVLLRNAEINLSVNGNNFFVDTTNKRVGIENNKPTAKLHINGSEDALVNISNETTTLFYIDGKNRNVSIGFSPSGAAASLTLFGTFYLSGGIAMLANQVFSIGGSQILSQATTPITHIQSLSGGANPWWFYENAVSGANSEIRIFGFPTEATTSGYAAFQIVGSNNDLRIDTNVSGSNIRLMRPIRIIVNDTNNFSTTNVLTLDHFINNPVNSTGGIGVSMLFRAMDNASQFYNIANISAILYNATNGSQAGALTFGTVGSDTGDGSKGHLIERMRINANGSVGIGTTNPLEKLVVIGNANISGTLNVSGRVALPNIAGQSCIGSDAGGVLQAGTCVSAINTNDLAIVNVTMFDNNTIIRTGNLTTLNTLNNYVEIGDFNLGKISNDTIPRSANISVALWNMSLPTDGITRALMFPRDLNSSVLIGFGNVTR
ncbi:hypothetical protein HYU50_00595 [Candidatus Woesearchaeota archaeon]|nr:hypothetical protein [Candidatus Woesearchaeota archaeon]